MAVDMLVQIILLVTVFVIGIVIVSLCKSVCQRLLDIYRSVERLEKKVGVDDAKVPVVPKDKLKQISKVCPNCGVEVNSTDKYCTKCGQKFVDNWAVFLGND